MAEVLVFLLKLSIYIVHIKLISTSKLISMSPMMWTNAARGWLCKHLVSAKHSNIAVFSFAELRGPMCAKIMRAEGIVLSQANNLTRFCNYRRDIWCFFFMSAGFECRCGGLFCAIHRYSDKHDCSFNYREMGAQEIRRNNPVVVGEKIQKIWTPPQVCHAPKTKWLWTLTNLGAI